MSVRCDLTELPVDQCAHCLGHLDTDPLDDLRIERFFTARYDGVCAVDKRPIATGDQIGLIEGGGYACERCSREARG